MWRGILILAVLSGCQTAQNIKPIESSPHHVKFSYNEWYGGNQWPGMQEYADAYCSSLGKSVFFLRIVDNSLNKHVTYVCVTPEENAWTMSLCNPGSAMCSKSAEIFLTARGVDTKSQMKKLLRASGAVVSSLPPVASPVMSTRNAPIGYSSCTYKVGNTVWTDTIKGINCPPSSSKGGLVGVLVR